MSGESLRERSRRNQQRDFIRTDTHVRRACGDTRNFIKRSPAAAKLSLRESEKENKGEEEEATPRIGDTARFVCVREQNTLYAPASIVHAHLYCVVLDRSLITSWSRDIL